MAGEVHDENAYAMGGVSGHAGLFSTARDLARFARMLIAKGEFFEALADSAGQAPANATIPVQAGEMPSSETLCMRLPSRRGARQLLSPESVCLLNTPQIPGIDPEAGLAWRMCLEGESAIGFLASPRSFGHTGFTGTSLWIDPDNRIAAVLLTNSAHPARGGASAKEARLSFHRATVRIFSPAPAQRTKSGLDVLEAEGFERLAGKRVAIAANHTAINGRGESIFSLLRKQTNLELAMIFGPEHGFAGRAGAGEKVGDDEWEGVPVLSLYGQRRKPPPESAEKFDVMLFDIQDVGARFYTYIWTLFQIQQFCAESGKPLIVLDRPNPIGGRLIEGPVLDAANASFLGLKPLPIRHGLTVGELALLYNRAGWLGPGLTAELDVVAMDGWRREMAFIETGLPWAAPSPNMRTWDTALVYPGTCLFEGTQWSEGRGTNNPFELVGGPGVDSRRLAMELNALGLEGCRFLPAEFTPAAPPEDAIRPKLEDQRCGGVFLRVDDRESFRPVRAGLAMLIALRGLYPGRHQWRASSFDRLAGTDSIRTHIDAGTPLATIEATWSEGLAQFDALRRAVAIYE